MTTEQTGAPALSGRKFFMNFPVTDSSHTLASYRARGGYQALEKALKEMQPADVTKEVSAAGLLGHGGAAFPAGRKWGVIKPNDGEDHFVCMNADEGEPGTFKDRWILEHTPHLCLEGLILASYAIGGRHAFIYIRGEFDLPFRRIQGAVDEAYAAGLLGTNILGTGYSLDVVVYRGAGSYVCGEASAMLASLEGRKGWPRNRPPRLTVKGLYQKPTVVNNVETLANVPVIISLGAVDFKTTGTPKSPGTQMISISGHIALPGVYEVEYGYLWEKFIYEDCGGMQDGKALKCIIPGGVSTKILDANEIKGVTLDHNSAVAAGSQLGSGGMIAVAEGTCMVRLARVIQRFYHHESCGQCTPCREGMGWMERILDRIVRGEGRPEDIDRLYLISNANDGTTICSLGDSAGYACTAILDHYRDEFEYYILNGRSMFDGRLAVADPFEGAVPAPLYAGAAV
ncbi:NADH-quinone oxidoreductase subunit NuoF [Gemmatimonas sp.]|uniref:NADH-quinone oxidoreductase subunit NuoF n=1 Tax=Gemmatimonas sp. TaxID=1962908 RepID=UPI003F6EB8A0